MLKEFPNSYGIGIDISNGALQVALQNSISNQVNERCQLVQCDLRNIEQKNFLPFDIIISNPPYIKTSEILRLQPEVRDYEPRIALDGGEDGLLFYRQIGDILQRSNLLKKDGILVLEVGYEQANDVKQIFSSKQFLIELVRKDLNGIERCIVARKRE